MYIHISKCCQNKVVKRNSTSKKKKKKRSLRQHIGRAQVPPLSFVGDYSAHRFYFLIVGFFKTSPEPELAETKPFLLQTEKLISVSSLLLLSRLGFGSLIWRKRMYLCSWGLGITFMMVVVLMRFIVSWRWNQTLRSRDSGFLYLLVITSFVENDSESFGRGWITRVPFPKFWQWSSFISLYTRQKTDLFIIKTAETLANGNDLSL